MHNDKNTLVILTPGFPADEHDQNCLTFPQLFVKNLKLQFPDLKIIVIAFQYPYRQGNYQWNNVEVIALAGRGRAKLNRLKVWQRALRTLKKLHMEFGLLGILNFWMGECALVGSFFAKRHALQHFTWILGQDARKKNQYMFLVGPKPQTLVALSDFLWSEVYKNYKLQAGHIIPPGIDPKAYSPIINTRDIDIIGVGSLIPLKRFEVFLKVVAQLIKTFPKLKVVICGSGSEQSNLQQQINELGISTNVSLYGEVAHPDTIKLMQRSRILLHTSEYEGFPTVYSEALYAGANVVGFFSPMNNLFEQQYKCENENDMIATTKTLLEKPELPDQRIMTYWISDICQQILALYSRNRPAQINDIVGNISETQPVVEIILNNL